MKILVSTGALIGRPNNRDYRLLLPLSKELCCDGYEFMMYSDWYDKTQEITEFIKENSIKVFTYHCQKSIGEAISQAGEEKLSDALKRFEINAKMASELGAKKLVLHLWDGVTSDAFFSNNLKTYPVLNQMAQRFGLELLVENVVCNQKDPLFHWCQLREAYPDIRFVFDTKMAAFHGQLEMLYTAEYEWLWINGHIRHYHVNDYGGAVMDWGSLRTLPIGKGNIDFERFCDFIKQTGYDETMTLESTAFRADGSVDTDMLNGQIKYLREKFSK